MKNLLIILLILFSSMPTMASGYSGSYLLKGTAKHNGEPLISKEIQVTIGLSDTTIYTDSVGQFEIRIQWSTFHLVGTTQKSVEKQNPKKISFKYMTKSVRVKNEWKLSYEVFTNPDTPEKHVLIEYPEGKEPMLFGDYPPHLYPNIIITKDLIY